jgi:hypothetical protein
MKIQTESELYGPVRAWLQELLARRYRGHEVLALDTSRTRLSTVVAQRGLQARFPQAGVWDIQADITAFILGKESHVAFVECKKGPITLKDVGQLLGYSLVARPLLAILLSVEEPSDALRTLLVTYGRYDILEYDRKGSRIRIVQWDPARRAVLHAATLPPGEHV